MNKRRIAQARAQRYILDGVEPVLAERMARQEIRRMRAKERIKAKKEATVTENPPEKNIIAKEENATKDNDKDAEITDVEGTSEGLRLERGGEKTRNNKAKTLSIKKRRGVRKTGPKDNRKGD